MVMALAPESVVVEGCFAFALWWLVAVFPAFPLLPIGRTAGSLVGAVLMVLLGVISADDAFKAVDLPILGLLFATMVISVYLERAKAFDSLATLLSWRTQGGKDLLCRVCVLAAISSAVFTNDSTCVVLTGFVLKLCNEKNLNPEPFLIALACSANIGSAATPIGNPQNLVIAVQGNLGFWQFVFGILPAVLVGLVINIVGLLLVYGGSLSKKSIEKGKEKIETEDNMALLPLKVLDVSSSRNDSVDVYDSFNHSSDLEDFSNSKCSGQTEKATVVVATGAESRLRTTIDFVKSWIQFLLVKRKEGGGKILGFFVIVGIWILGATRHAVEAGMGLPWTAITAAMILTVVDFSDATETLDKVSYSILVFFSGMFITVEGFNRTGARLNSVSRRALLSN